MQQTGTTRGNSLHLTKQWIVPNDDDRPYSGSPTYTANWLWFMVGNLLEEVHLLHGPQLPLSENPLPRPGLGQLVQACEVVSHQPCR